MGGWVGSWYRWMGGFSEQVDGGGFGNGWMGGLDMK